MTKLTTRQMAARVQREGHDGDTILAHISPAEAKYMAKKFGQNTNPVTGLPQYGLFRKIEKALRKPWKVIAPIAGTVIGGLAGGPVGALIGGTAGGAATSKSKPLKGALKGAAWGALLPDAMGMAQGIFGGGAAAGAAGASGAGAGAAGQAAGKEAAGLFGNLTGMQKILGGAAIAGALKGKSKHPKYDGPSLQEIQQQAGMGKQKSMFGNDFKLNLSQRAPRRRNVSITDPAQMRYEQQWYDDPDYYAHGGNVQAPVIRDGQLYSKTGAQTDDIEVRMVPHSYVWDGTSISLYGDGDTEAGRHRLLPLKDKFIKAAYEHGYRDPHPEHEEKLPAMVSGGEDIWPPAAVYGAGVVVKGDPRKGVKVLDTFRKNLRKQKKIDTFLPPKSKHAGYYFKGVK